MNEELKGVGARLRAVRRSKNLTLDALAGSVGMSASTLSRLESGKRQASLELLVPLVKRLGVTIDDLLIKPNTDPRVKRKVLHRAGLTIVPLAPENAVVSTFKITYPATTAQPTPRVHEGFEWFYVLSGKIRLLLGEQDLVIETGEAAQFDTRIPHAMSAADSESAQVISIFNAAGAAMHIYSAE